MNNNQNPAKRPEVREKLRQVAIRRWADKAEREKLLESHKASAEKKRTTVIASWKDPEVRSRRMLGKQNSITPKYREKQSAIRKKFLATHPEALAEFVLVAKTLGNPASMTEEVQRRREATLRTLRKTAEFKTAHKNGLLRASEAGKFDFLQEVGGYGKKEWYFSAKNQTTIFCGSSWESARVRVLEKNPDVISYQKSPLRIPYFLEDGLHHYHVDFLVKYANGEKILEEVKPSVWFDDPVVIAKFAAARKYCRKNNIPFRVLGTEESLQT